METAAYHFALEGQPVSCTPFGHGHINRTRLLETDAGRRYILQMINGAVFKDADGLMENVAAVTGHISQKVSSPRECLHPVSSLDGGLLWRDEEGQAWRVYDFIEGGLCLERPEQPGDLYESALAFGKFQNQLADFPAHTLHETIACFHDTPDRYRRFKAALAADVCGRAAGAAREIDFVLEQETEAGMLQDMRRRGLLPLRVTHNDTKLNNVMLDAKSRRALCVMDLDTVMPGLAAFDFGDSIRFGASTASEDESELARVWLDMELFEIYTGGFLAACPSLTDTERETLPLGAKTMTLEQGLRFLTDYLAGDTYFHANFPEHNLLRARTQLKLVWDMEQKWELMTGVVNRLMK